MKILNQIALCFVASATLFSACNTEPLEVVDYKDNYQTLADADNMILGVYGLFMGLMEQQIVLNELRGDLMDVSINASVELQEINTKSPSPDNKYNDISAYYKVIQNCNDILAGFDKMYAEHRLTTDQYNERYSDIMALRCWTYLQVGIQWGNVVYVTDPTVTVSDAEKLKSQPTITFDQLIQNLIKDMQSCPTLEPYINSPLIAYNLDTYALKYFFVNKYLVFGDIYLYADQYLEAAKMYRTFWKQTSDTKNGVEAAWVCKTGMPWGSAGYEKQFFITYERYHGTNIDAFKQNWTDMFSMKPDNAILWQEMIWCVSYDARFKPAYTMIDLFDNEGQGQYQLKPSTHAIKNIWGTERQTNQFPFDARGEGTSFILKNGQEVIQKYLFDYNPGRPYEKMGRWFLYRAGTLFLHYAEAANRAGYPDLADAILNQGFQSKYGSVESDPYFTIREQTNDGYKLYEFPFYFDARQNDAPYFRATFQDFRGIRPRANLVTKRPTAAEAANKQDSIYFYEKAILNEMALEAAFEGYRWGDLTRIARRMNKEGRDGNKFLQDMLRPKYEMSGQTMPDYSSEDKWYLPFNK